MDKLLIIAFGYDGENSNNANSICLEKIIKYVSKENDITLVTSSSDNFTSILNDNSSIKVYKVPFNTRNNGKIDFNNWRRRVIREISNFDISSFSKMLTISFPFPTLKIGYDLKKRFSHIEWFVYELDPYAYNRILRYPRLLFFYRLLIERRIFGVSDKIFLTHELFNSYKNSLLSDYSHKFIDIGIPLLEVLNFKSEINEEGRDIQLTYIGSLYSKVRNSEYILKVFEDIKGIKINFYGADPSQISDAQKNIFGDRLVVHGRIPKSEVRSVLNDSDVLLNIGNNTNNQLPSKVLEYIGTGKPIISIYNIEDDTSNLYLKKYPNSLLINQKDDLEKNKTILKKYLLDINNNNIIIDSQKIETIFGNDTIEAVARRVINSLNISNYKEGWK
jgi:hypothetical protein